MSLDWNIDRVADWKEKCWLDNEDGTKRLNPDTDCLIWGSLILDLGEITEDNIDEWLFRIKFLRETQCGWYDKMTDDGVVAYYPDRQLLIDHIGLATNVASISRTKWLAKQRRRISDKINREIEREKANG